tara:strand:+ start:72 stop:383 length:312 start_codon:yes stop_codon:yes gene_type:complete
MENTMLRNFLKNFFFGTRERANPHGQQTSVLARSRLSKQIRTDEANEYKPPFYSIKARGASNCRMGIFCPSRCLGEVISFSNEPVVPRQMLSHQRDHITPSVS